MVPWTETYQFLWLLSLWGRQPAWGAAFPGGAHGPPQHSGSHRTLPPGGPARALHRGVSGSGSTETSVMVISGVLQLKIQGACVLCIFLNFCKNTDSLSLGSVKK